MTDLPVKPKKEVKGLESGLNLPKHMAETNINDKKLREVPLLDFHTPIINSYIICKESMKETISEVFPN